MRSPLGELDTRLATIQRRVAHAHARIERYRTEMFGPLLPWTSGLNAPTVAYDPTKVWSKATGTLKVTRTDVALTTVEATRDVDVAAVERLDVAAMASASDAAIVVRLGVYLSGAGIETGQALGASRAVEAVGNWVDLSVGTTIPAWATTARIQIVGLNVPTGGSVWIDALHTRSDRRT